MDTRTRPQIIHRSEPIERRIEVRPRASFGLASLRRHTSLMVLGTLAGLLLAALFVTLRPAKYTASSQLLIYIRQVLTGPDQAILPGRADLPMVQNQIELLRSGNVLTQVVQALQLTDDAEFAAPSMPPGTETASRPLRGPQPETLGLNAALEALRGKLAVRQVGTSHMVTVSCQTSDPVKAARIVNAVARTYLLERARASDAASSRAPTLREIYQSLGPSAQVVSEAEPPIRKDGPPAALILASAALLGFGVAGAVALLLDLGDDTIRNERQMEFVLGLECLGSVPRFSGIDTWSEDAAAQRLLGSDSPVPGRALDALREMAPCGVQVIGITSAVPGEGATTIAIALAKAAAAAGRRVLLVDAAQDNPSLSRWAASLSVDPPSPGAEWHGDVLGGIVPMQPGLDVLPLAERFAASDALMPGHLLAEVVRAADQSHDVVIVDLPALVAGPQVRAAAASLDGFILVARSGATASGLIRQAYRSAGQARPRFIGTILNMAEREAAPRQAQAPGPVLRAKSFA